MADAVKPLGVELARLFAGVSISSVTGFWASDGDRENGPYGAGGIEMENSIRIELSVLPDQKEAAIDALRETTSRLNRELSLEANYLHIEFYETNTAHQVIS
jgi:hypothetical protein